MPGSESVSWAGAAVIVEAMIGKSTAGVNGDVTGRGAYPCRSSYRRMDLASILDRVERRLQFVELTATEASARAGKPDAIRNMRRAVQSGGRQGVSTATIQALAPVLETTAAWLLEGAGDENSPPPEQIEIRGVITAGGFVNQHSEVVAKVAAPEGATSVTSGFLVGEAALPTIAEPGWYVFYESTTEGATADMLGKKAPVVCGLEDGSIVVRRIRAGSQPGHYHLVLPGEEPIVDARVAWAAKVTWIKPRWD